MCFNDPPTHTTILASFGHNKQSTWKHGVLFFRQLTVYTQALTIILMPLLVGHLALFQRSSGAQLEKFSEAIEVDINNNQQLLLCYFVRMGGGSY